MDSLRIIGTFNTPVNRLRAADAPPETDALSQTIRAVSQRLKSCSLYHVAVSEEIFFPLCLDVKDGAPHWQRLEGFYLNFPPATPCGQLLFETEPAAAGSDDEDAASSTSSVDSDSRHQQRRLKPGKATAKMQRFHLAAARAALEMPLLKNMVLTAWVATSWRTGTPFLTGRRARARRQSGPAARGLCRRMTCSHVGGRCRRGMLARSSRSRLCVMWMQCRAFCSR